ncbi:MAG: AAA family ATPase [Gammaproteobacteria bacterium]
METLYQDHMQRTISSVGRDLHAHPLCRNRAILPTRALEDLANQIVLWLDNLLPGGVVWGISRAGKSQASMYMARNFNELTGLSIPIAMISMWSPSQTSITERRFFQELLHCIGYAIPNSGTAAEKRRRAIDLMKEQALEKMEYRYLLIVDEAQNLAVPQYEHLSDLYNALNMENIQLITVSVGSPELLTMKERFRAEGKGNMIGRFMTAVHRFDGILGFADFARIVESLDFGSEFPVGSDISYTQYYLPVAFGSGFRLSNCSQEMWTVLLNECHKAGMTKISELPMQPITALISWILKTLSKQDRADLDVSSEFLAEAVQRVSLLQILDLAKAQHP